MAERLSLTPDTGTAPAARLEPDAIGVAQDAVIGMASSAPGARELALYEDAFRFLARRGWPQAKINCHELDPGQVAARILRLLGRTSGQKRA